MNSLSPSYTYMRWWRRWLDSGNDLTPVRWNIITWSNHWVILKQIVKKNFSEILLIGEGHFKLASAKPFVPTLISYQQQKVIVSFLRDNATCLQPFFGYLLHGIDCYTLDGVCCLRKLFVIMHMRAMDWTNSLLDLWPIHYSDVIMGARAF